jgi:hypothetical protein
MAGCMGTLYEWEAGLDAVWRSVAGHASTKGTNCAAEAGHMGSLSRDAGEGADGFVDNTRGVLL